MYRKFCYFIFILEFKDMYCFSIKIFLDGILVIVSLFKNYENLIKYYFVLDSIFLIDVFYLSFFLRLNGDFLFFFCVINLYF